MQEREAGIMAGELGVVHFPADLYFTRLVSIADNPNVKMSFEVN